MPLADFGPYENLMQLRRCSYRQTFWYECLCQILPMRTARDKKVCVLWHVKRIQDLAIVKATTLELWAQNDKKNKINTGSAAVEVSL